MDLAGLLGLLRRQWILVGIVLLIAATSAFLTWESATPTYRSNTTLSVLPPRVNVEGVARNPYLDIASASNADIAQRLSIQVNGTLWRDRLTNEGFSPDYLIDHGDATSPILRVGIETDSPELSEATLNAVVEAVREELATQQERFGVDERSRFTLDTLDRSPGAKRVFGNRTRLTGAILVLGFIASVVAAQLLDNYRRRRVGRHGAGPLQTTDPRMTTYPASQTGDSREKAGVWVPRPNVDERPTPTPAANVPTHTAGTAARQGPILNDGPRPVAGQVPSSAQEAPRPPGPGNRA